MNMKFFAVCNTTENPNNDLLTFGSSKMKRLNKKVQGHRILFSGLEKKLESLVKVRRISNSCCSEDCDKILTSIGNTNCTEESLNSKKRKISDERIKPSEGSNNITNNLMLNYILNIY